MPASSYPSPPHSANAPAPAFPDLHAFLETNRQWAANTKEVQPDLLPRLAKAQTPSVLWLGCADSRVPESVIMARQPGDVFVHVTSQFQLEDDSANAVLNYGVGTVGVTHVVVVGHTACGGCVAAYDMAVPDASAPSSHLSRFLTPLIKLRHSLPEGATTDDLIRENVKLSVENIAKSETMQEIWAKAKRGEHKAVYVHGWVFDIASGLLNDLEVSKGPNSLA
ncbi:hypothetical protein Q5752_003755 [Cryptotrichosporon argae]